MSNQRLGHRRARARKAVAVSVIWAGLGTGGLVAEHASAASPAAPAASASAGASTARAAHDPTGLLKAASVPVHGVADDGTELFGAFQLEHFQVHGGVLSAVGALTGTLGGSRSVTKNNVRIPVSGATEPATPTSGLLQADAVPTPNACTILTLNLGKLDLNLLGLHVVLDPVSLLVEAVPGAGALVGNLLCGITNLLNGGVGLGGLLTNVLTAIANLLNGLLTV
jgi:hypothetical protein